jgi:Spy/CpxP family protein refolding chaperone
MLRIAAALPLILASLSGIQGAHAGPGTGMMQGIIGRLLSPQAIEQLELTDEQVAELEDLRSSHEKAVLEIKHKIENAQLELNELMREDEPSESKIKAKIREIGSLRVDLQLAQVDTYFAARKILTAEQIEKIKSLRGINRGPGRRTPGYRTPGYRGGGTGNLGEPGGPMNEDMPPGE